MKKILLFASVASLGMAAHAQVQMSLSDEFYLANLQNGGITMQSAATPAPATAGALVEINDEAVIARLEEAGATIEKNIWQNSRADSTCSPACRHFRSRGR